MAPAEEAGYDDAWAAVRDAVNGAEGYAWRFALAADPAVRIEFLEFKGDADPRTRPEVRSLLDRLDGFGEGEVEEWVDR